MEIYQNPSGLTNSMHTLPQIYQEFPHLFMSWNFLENILAAFSIGNISTQFLLCGKLFSRKDHQNFPQLFPSNAFPQNICNICRFSKCFHSFPPSLCLSFVKIWISIDFLKEQSWEKHAVLYKPPQKLPADFCIRNISSDLCL